MFKFTILLIFYFNACHCNKQPVSTSDYGGQSGDQTQKTVSLPKPQAIIHLPENVYTHKLTDTIKLDHDQLSNYLSSINYIPHTIHKHAQMLAQLDSSDLQKYGQSVNSNQLPLISLTVPDSKNSDYNDAQMKMEDYSAAPQPQQGYQAPQSNSGYQQQQGGDYKAPQQPQQSYGQQQQSYGQQQQSYGQQQQSYTPPQAPRKNCNQNKNSDSYGQQEPNSQEYGNAGYSNADEGSGENAGGYENKSPEVEYQSGPMDNNNNYDSGNNNYDSGNNNYDSGNSYYSNENNGGGSYENQDGGNSYENNNSGEQQDNGYSNNQQPAQQSYGKQSGSDGNDYSSENYESSPFDYNFVQEILKHVMNQLEQLQIDPDSLSAYGKVEDSNQGGDYGGSQGGGNGDYGSQGGAANGYEVQGGRQGIQLVDRPDGQQVSYGYSINHGGYESQPAQNQGSNGYEPSYTSSSTTSQATSYSANEPAVILDNKIPINENKRNPSTVTYQMPTINLELPKKQIEHIMKSISGKKGAYSQPIMIKANSFKLPSNLNLGKIKTIAFIKGSKGMKDLPYFNTQMLGSNVNTLSDYQIVSAMSKKEETKYDSNPVLSAYGYGVSLPSSKMYASSSSNKKSIILPLKARSKKLANSYSSLQAASSNIKSIISALPKINKKSSSTAKAASAPVATIVQKK